MPEKKIKRCALCDIWFTASEIITNPDIKPLGMTIMDDNIDKVYYFFQHTVPDCGTSFMVEVTELAEFITEPIPPNQITFSKSCEGRCARIDDLLECHQECRLAPFRRFLSHMITLKSAYSSVPDESGH